MKQRPVLVLAAALAAALALPVAVHAEDKAIVTSSPGQATIAQKRRLVATVEAVDAAKREITLKGPKGKVVPLSVAPDVRNLEQVKVGDQLVVTYIEALSLTLKKDGKELRGATESTDGARAPAGARPGAVAARQVEVTADVIAVDPKTQTVTLKGPQRTVDLKVPDPGQFKLVKVGDQVQAVYTEALALGVEPAAKK